jgi:hypothetical protein
LLFLTFSPRVSDTTSDEVPAFCCNIYGTVLQDLIDDLGGTSTHLRLQSFGLVSARTAYCLARWIRPSETYHATDQRVVGVAVSIMILRVQSSVSINASTWDVAKTLCDRVRWDTRC